MAGSFDADLGSTTSSGTHVTEAAAASDALIIGVGWWFGTQTMNASFSTGGLTWTRDIAARGTIAGDQSIAIFSAPAVSGLAISTGLTPAFSATPSFGPAFAFFSLLGMDLTSGRVDDTAGLVEDFNETWATGAMDSTGDAVAVACSAVSDATTHTPNGTGVLEASPEFQAEGSQYLAQVYKVLSGAVSGIIGGIWGQNVSFQHNIGVIYKAAAGGPPPPPPIIVRGQAGAAVRA